MTIFYTVSVSRFHHCEQKDLTVNQTESNRISLNFQSRFLSCYTVTPPRLRTCQGENLPVKPPLYKNLFSLKFETGSYFIKSTQKFFTLSREDKSTFRILFGDIGALALQLQCNGLQVLYEE